MEEDNLNNDIPSIRIKPDFKVLRSIIYTKTGESNFKAYVKSYKQNGYQIVLHFMTTKEASEIFNNIRLVIQKYGLLKHEENLGYLLIENYRQTYIRDVEGRIPNLETSKRAPRFANFIDFLLAHPGKQFEVFFKETLTDSTLYENKRFKEERKSKQNSKAGSYYTSQPPETLIKPVTFTLNDKYISRWLINTAIKAVEAGDVSLQMGYQLINSKIVEDSKRKRKVLKLAAPIAAYEDVSKSTIWNDAIADICFPIINYLKAVTHLKDDNVKLWSTPQLMFLFELMIAIGYLQTSSEAGFEFGVSSPTQIDKNRISAILNNRIRNAKRKESTI